MKCQVCGERDATIHYIEIVEGQKTSQWVCSQCAEREGITPIEVSPLVHGKLGSFLGGMLPSAPASRPPEKSPRVPPCEVCGYEYDQLEQKSQLGCPACYLSFRKQLLPMLQRYHGGVQHLGKLPRSHGPQAALRREITRLKKLLDQAVAEENYEEAARIRDSIRDKERQEEQVLRESRSASGGNADGVTPADGASGADPSPTGPDGTPRQE